MLSLPCGQDMTPPDMPGSGVRMRCASPTLESRTRISDTHPDMPGAAHRCRAALSSRTSAACESEYGPADTATSCTSGSCPPPPPPDRAAAARCCRRCCSLAVAPDRRRDCHFDDTPPCLSLLEQLRKVQGGCGQMTVSPTASRAWHTNRLQRPTPRQLYSCSSDSL